MLNHATAQIFICLDPMDMRKSFDTLAQVVRANLGQDLWWTPKTGQVP